MGALLALALLFGSTETVLAQDTPPPDADADGISDEQDACPNRGGARALRVALTAMVTASPTTRTAARRSGSCAPRWLP